MFHLINHDPTFLGASPETWRDAAVILAGVFVLAAAWAFMIWEILDGFTVTRRFFRRVWAAVTFKKARARRRAAREAAQARDARTAKILADIIAGAEPPVKNPLQWPYATDYVAAANRRWDETTTPERKHVYPWIIVDARTYAASEFIFRHDHKDLVCVADIEHAATGVRATTSLMDTGRGLRNWIDGDPISALEVSLITSFLRYQMAEPIRKAAPTKLEQTLTQTLSRVYPTIRAAGREYRASDYDFSLDESSKAVLLQVVHRPTNTHMWSEDRPTAEAMRKWLSRLPITQTEGSLIARFIPYETPPTPEQELTRLRATNARLENELRDLRRDNDLAIREYEKSKHAIQEAESSRELVNAVARQRAELQGQLAAARATITNLHHDLELVIAKGRRRKAAIRKLEAAHAHLSVLLTGEQRRNAHQYRIFLDAAGDAHRLRREVADRDRIIDDYHDAATGTASRLCPDRNPQTGAPCLRAWGHEPFQHRSVARENAGVLWEYWATVPAVPRNPL